MNLNANKLMFKVIRPELSNNKTEINSCESEYESSSNIFAYNLVDNFKDPNKIILKRTFLNNNVNEFVNERVVKKCKKSRNSWSRKEVRI